MLLLVSLVTGPVQAQHGGAGSVSFSVGPSARPSATAPTHFANRFSGHGAASVFHHHHHNGYGSLVYPYYFPYDYSPYDESMDQQPYTEIVEREPAVPAPPAPIAPPSRAQVIDIPSAANSAAAKPLPPAVFILTTGERLEASRFLLTAATLSVSIDRRQRTIPFDQLNLDATIAANRKRGIELRVPADQNEISLSF